MFSSVPFSQRNALWVGQNRGVGEFLVAMSIFARRFSRVNEISLGRFSRRAIGLEFAQEKGFPGLGRQRRIPVPNSFGVHACMIHRDVRSQIRWRKRGGASRRRLYEMPDIPAWVFLLVALRIRVLSSSDSLDMRLVK